MELKRVVVTGLGAITPIGNTIDEYWNGLINGVSGADMITLFDASKFKTKFACEIKGFEPTHFLKRKKQERSIGLHKSHWLQATRPLAMPALQKTMSILTGSVLCLQVVSVVLLLSRKK